MIWMLQLKGLVATGLLAAYGFCIIMYGYEHACSSHHKWTHFFGWLVIGSIFFIPFIAVAVSVWLSRWPA